MGNDKDIKSSAEESIHTENNSPGFFIKYTPADGDEPRANPYGFFNRYLPSRHADPIADKERTEITESELISGPADTQPDKHVRKQRINSVWRILVLLALVPLALGIWHATKPIKRSAMINDDPSIPTYPDPKMSPDADSNTGTSAATPPLMKSSRTSSLTKVERQSFSSQLGTASASPPLGTMLMLAREFEDRWMLERAKQEYSAILARFPGDQQSILGLNRVQSIISKQRTDEAARQNRETGLNMFRRGDYASAAMYLSASVDGGYSDTATLYSLGMSYLKSGRSSEARTALERCVAANPDYSPALVGLAEVERKRGHIGQAVSLLRRALELGGGAEFTPVRITEMISALVPETKTTPNQPKPILSVTAVHQHAFPFSHCRGQVTMDDSTIRFISDKPSHNFSVSRDAVKNMRASGSQLDLNVNGKAYTLILDGYSARDFLKAMGHGRDL